MSMNVLRCFLLCFSTAVGCTRALLAAVLPPLLHFSPSQNILHRDVSLRNIFVTSNQTLKIGDFGISKVGNCM